MKRINKLFIILPILLLSSCGKSETIVTPSIKYQMDFNDNINEKITIYMPSDAEEKAKLPSTEETIEPPIEYTYLYSDLNPLINDYNYVYKKSDIIKTEDYTYLDLTANLDYENIVNSTTFNSCFEKVNIEPKDGYINILLGGHFICSYGDNTTLEFSGENLISTSLPKTDNNVYRMKLDNELTDYIKLSINTKHDTSKTKKSNSFIKIYTTIGILFFLAFASFILIFKHLNSTNSF